MEILEERFGKASQLNASRPLRVYTANGWTRSIRNVPWSHADTMAVTDSSVKQWEPKDNIYVEGRLMVAEKTVPKQPI